MTIQNLPLRRAILAAGAVLGTVLSGSLLATPANAAEPATITLDNGILTIDGDAADNGLIVGRSPAGVISLNGTPVLGGTATLSTVSLIRMNGGAGNDTLKLDETNGAMPAAELTGGDGNDKLAGGSGVDTLVGGSGNDRISGGPGNDTVSMGDGSDEFTLNTGDGSDHLDGDGDKDTLLFNGFQTFGNFTQFVSVTPDGPRTTLRRAQPIDTGHQILDVLSVGGVELVKMNLDAGPGKTRVNEFSFDGTGADIGVLRVALGTVVNPDPNLRNFAGVLGTDGADRIRIGGRPAEGATVTGLGGGAIITGAYTLSVNGLDGDDVIDAAQLTAGTVLGYSADGGALDSGNDTLIGSAGDDLLRGGNGNDRIEGRAGNDHLVGDDQVPGDDRILGGDGDDLIEGGGGHDILDGGAGNNVIIP